MASNYTTNYGLCQWAAADKVLRTEFNGDNAKIDAAIKAVDVRVDGKVSTSELNSLKGTVTGLSQTLAGHTAALSGKGNCQLSVVSYTGTGQSGAASPNSLTFSAVPEVVFIGKSGCWLALVPGETFTWTLGPAGGVGQVTVSWSGKSVQWYSTNAQAQMNQSSTTYNAIVLTRLS